MNKEEFKREILEGMCTCAEEISDYWFQSEAVNFDGECPRPFKPGVSDKMLFRQIIEKNIDTIIKDNKKDGSNSLMIGVHLMARFYYPQYGLFDETQLERPCGRLIRSEVSKRVLEHIRSVYQKP